MDVRDDLKLITYIDTCDDIEVQSKYTNVHDGLNVLAGTLTSLRTMSSLERILMLWMIQELLSVSKPDLL